MPYFGFDLDPEKDYGDLFIDGVPHLSDKGHALLGENIFNHLVANDFFRDGMPPLKLPYCGELEQIPISGMQPRKAAANLLPKDEQTQLYAYLGGIRQIAPKIGAIVMNCNPFTLGHRYLVEYAASQVEHLYIFAIEEDKSIFPFVDRFELIKA